MFASAISSDNGLENHLQSRYIEISLAPQMVLVPNVVGMAQADANSTITSAGLTVGTITHAYSSTVPAGDVISQNPLGGTSVAINSTVDLVLSDGNAPHHPSDKNNNNVIDDFELLDYIDLWKQGQVDDFELLDTIGFWKAGHYYWDPTDEKFKSGEQP